jgi:heme o synthase
MKEMFPERVGGQSVALPGRTIAGYLALTKPGLTTLSVCTSVGGAYLASNGHPSPSTVVNLVIGTLLVGAGAGALNQWIERRFDAVMKRTSHRPIPSGEIRPLTALIFGLLCAVLGSGYLYAFTTHLAGILSIVVLLVYLLAYTPLKRKTHLSTAVGGVPGALPPLIGWVATGRGLGLEAYLLFLLLFLWQMPHFLALAWMYRHDYERAGYRMLPSFDVSGIVTGRLVVLYASTLLPVGVGFAVVGLMGWVFLAGSILAGGYFLVTAASFARDLSNSSARRLFYSSLLYLSAVLVLMLVDRVVLG